MLILKILWRLIVVMVGFLSAIAAAVILLGSVLRNDVMQTLQDGSNADLGHLIGGVFLVVAVASISFIPWAIATVLAELLQFRSIFYHLIVGGLCGAAASLMHAYTTPYILQLGIATGLVAGLVYWLIAGRRAGDWLPKPPNSQVRPPPPPQSLPRP